jgi:uncharacterized protein DUF5675
MPKLKVTLTRSQYLHDAIIGDLAAGEFSCKTLELPYRNNEPMISAIPEGIYSVGMALSPRFKKLYYRLSGVQGREGVLIHAGNTASDINGCILLGNAVTEQPGGITFLMNSRKTLAAFVDHMKGEPFTLIVRSGR